MSLSNFAAVPFINEVGEINKIEKVAMGNWCPLFQLKLISCILIKFRQLLIIFKKEPPEVNVDKTISKVE